MVGGGQPKWGPQRIPRNLFVSKGENGEVSKICKYLIFLHTVVWKEDREGRNPYVMVTRKWTTGLYDERNRWMRMRCGKGNCLRWSP